MTRLRASAVREHFADALNRVAYRGERIVLHRRGKELAAIVPISDLEIIEQMEDRLDVKAARAALAESDERIPYEKIRRELGLA